MFAKKSDDPIPLINDPRIIFIKLFGRMEKTHTVKF